MKNRSFICLVVLFVLTLLVTVCFWIYDSQKLGHQQYTWLLPSANKSDFNESVTVSLPQLLANCQFKNPTHAKDHSEYINLIYIYNRKSNTGRLVTITQVPDDLSIACLTIYEPEWTGAKNLFAHLHDSFRAKVIHRINITYMEGFAFLPIISVCEKEDPSVVVDIMDYTESASDHTQYFFGYMNYFSEDDSGFSQKNIEVRFMRWIPDGYTPNCTGFDAFMRTVTRFSLEEKLGI